MKYIAVPLCCLAAVLSACESDSSPNAAASKAKCDTASRDTLVAAVEYGGEDRKPPTKVTGKWFYATYSTDSTPSGVSNLLTDDKLHLYAATVNGDTVAAWGVIHPGPDHSVGFPLDDNARKASVYGDLFNHPEYVAEIRESDEYKRITTCAAKTRA